MERVSSKRTLWVVIIVIGCSLILFRSAATAKGEYQTEGSDPTTSILPDSGLNPNEAAHMLGSETEAAKEALALEAGGYFVIPPSGFINDGYDPDGYTISFAEGYLVGREYTSTCMAAAVNLPLGALIDGIEVRLNDENETYSAWFDLYRTNLETGNTESIASVTSPAGTTSGIVTLVDDTVLDPTVSDGYTYQVVTCLRHNMYIYGVRVGYSYVTYLPTVKN